MKNELKKKESVFLPYCSDDSFLHIDSRFPEPITFDDEKRSEFAKDVIEAIPIETHSSPKILVISLCQFFIPFTYFRTVRSSHP